MTTSLPTFFNDFSNRQYFGISIWIDPELVHSSPPLYSSLLPSPPSLMGPSRELLMLWALHAPLFALWLELSKLHTDCGRVARTGGLEAKGERLMCSMMLKRPGQHLPPAQECTAGRAPGTQAQPAPASCLGLPSAVTGIILLWQGKFF